MAAVSVVDVAAAAAADDDDAGAGAGDEHMQHIHGDFQTYSGLPNGL